VTSAATPDVPRVIEAPEALAFLERAGALLAGSLDYEETLRRVVQLAVPDLADWCGVLIRGADGATRELTSGHPDPQQEALLVEMRRRRRERDGASESLRVIETGQAILVSDVRGQEAYDVGPAERELLERMGPRSYMLVPLVARGRTLGALTLLSTREGRHYGPADAAFAEQLAARCALAIDNAHLYAEAERSLALLDTVFATAPVGLAFLDAEQRFVRINEALAAINGRPVAEHLGRTIEEVLGPFGAQLAAVHRRVMADGRQVVDEDVRGKTPGAPGEERRWTVFYTPVRGRDEQVVGVSVVVIDVTERLALLEAEREARVRADFLAEAGVLLDASLDYEETLRNVARIAVPRVADWCSVSVLDEEGVLREVATAHVDPAKVAVAEELNRRFPAPPDAPTGAPHVARTGVTEVTREITDEMIEAGVPDPEQRRLIRALGLRSAIVAPLRAGDRIFGALALVNAESGRLFDPPDVQLAEELARRAGGAIENARLYTERSRIAHTLQAKLLPERLPEIPGAQLAARYRAAGELNEVGGDFYDVFPRSDTEWALVVGDVSGKGAEAAAVTALARYSLRAAALEEGSPSEALQRLNTAMLHDGSGQFATVVLAYASAAEPAGLRVRLALGGHPPPLILRADGRVDASERFGTLLGMLPDPRIRDAAFELGVGDVLLLYTDGVTEAGPRREPVGVDGLRALLAGLAGHDPQGIVDAVEAAAVSAQTGEPRDDVALLALAVPLSPPRA
jgi:PAS domain S-box-containing protein